MHPDPCLGLENFSTKPSKCLFLFLLFFSGAKARMSPAQHADFVLRRGGPVAGEIETAQRITSDPGGLARSNQHV